MPLSARNQMLGKVTNIKNGTITAQVELEIGGQKLTSIISKDSVEEMLLKEGDTVKAVIKATSVMVMK